MNNLLRLLALSSLVAPSFALTENAVKADETSGSITGKVTFEGKRPDAPTPLKIGTEEAKGCVHGGGEVANEDRSLLISTDGGVANVVMTVAVKGMEVEVPTEPIAIDQKGCRFEPHVSVVPVGATVRYANSDGVNHNVHTYAAKNKQLNNNIAGGSHEEQELPKEETIKVTCDIHPWMSSHIFVTEDPVYTISSADGSFNLTGLPAGTYKVSWWHEKLGKGKSEEVTVEPGKAASLALKVGGESGGKKKGGRRRR